MDQYLGIPSFQKRRTRPCGRICFIIFLSLTKCVFVETEFSGMSTEKLSLEIIMPGLGLTVTMSMESPFLSVGVNRIDAERRKLELKNMLLLVHAEAQIYPN
ncbi:hypothetical protein O9992_21925 [Vibrio lentus]|nr:hypothetical protein [Vibrio lentus]